jgi:kumamolisin
MANIDIKRPPADNARRVGPANPDERISVTICIRRRGGAVLPGTRLTRDKFARTYGAAPEDLAKVASFAESHGLVEKERDIARRLVVFSGTVEQANAAFGLRLRDYEHSTGERYRGHEDHIHLPDDLADIVEGVFGLDNRKMARAHTAPGNAPLPAALPPTPLWVAQRYNFPPEDGTGQTIALLAFGNSYAPADIQAYFAGLGLPVPVPVSVVLDGANPTAGPPNGEVTLDIAVAGAVAPGAKLLVYFAPDTESGWIHAVSAAVHDSVNAPSVLSISWGWPELQHTGDFAWSAAAIRKMSAVFQEAAALGVTIFAATGDRGASCGMVDHHAHVLYPASDAWVTACGGTMFQAGAELKEVVWKTPGAATGGGVSEACPKPSWQNGAAVPPSSRRQFAGRGVPDVAGYAAGYNIVFGGAPMLSPGTSGVAPLWAGLVARLNQALGRDIGFLNPLLYGEIRAARALNAIVDGDNGFDPNAPFYKAGPGWNACTGLGTPDGMKILAALRAG